MLRFKYSQSSEFFNRCFLHLIIIRVNFSPSLKSQFLTLSSQAGKVGPEGFSNSFTDPGHLEMEGKLPLSAHCFIFGHVAPLLCWKNLFILRSKITIRKVCCLLILNQLFRWGRFLENYRKVYPSFAIIMGHVSKEISVRNLLHFFVCFAFSHSTECHPLLLLSQLAEEELYVQ